MRSVDRTTVGVPPRLEVPDIVAATDAIRGGNDARAAIYRHPEVESRLRKLYRDKCFLCEKLVGQKGEVEHFLPWHRDYPERAYLWTNLHWVCDECNQRKRRSPYRYPASSKLAALRTDLLDPTCPYEGLNVEQLIAFEPCTREAIALERVSDPVVKNTVEFLNDPLPKSGRDRRFTELSIALVDAGCRDLWQKMCHLKHIEPDHWKEPERTPQLEALNHADRIYEMFLMNWTPYATCIRSLVHPLFRLVVDDFRRMSDAYRQWKGLRPLTETPTSAARVPAADGSSDATPDDSGVRLPCP